MGWKQTAAGLFGSGLLRLWSATWRVDEQPRRAIDARRAAGGRSTVYVMWHSRILLGATTQRGLGLHVMISQHGDGEVIARIVRRLGFTPIRGSTTRGGREALHEATRALDAGSDVAITPDGPRGPRLVVHPGCVLAAMRSGAPIVPVGFDARSSRRLRSWDRFVVPRLFTRVAVRFGAPLDVPRDLDPEGVAAWCVRVQEALLHVTRAAADAVGAVPETLDEDPLGTAAARPA